MADSLRKNGIFYGWFVLAATFFSMFMVTGARNGFGAFVIPMENELELDRATISLAIAIGWLCNGVSQPFLGRLYDRFGGRTVISISLLVVGSCTMVLSLVNDISVFGLFVLDRFWFLVFIYGFVISVASGGASSLPYTPCSRDGSPASAASPSASARPARRPALCCWSRSPRS